MIRWWICGWINSEIFLGLQAGEVPISVKRVKGLIRGHL